MARLPVAETIIARLRTEPDGALSNKKIERYALLRAEAVISITAAWELLMTSKGGNRPSSNYQANVHKSRAFKARLEALMDEKQALGDTVWGQLEWMTRQNYRRAAAVDDLKMMQAATDTLLKIAQRNDRPEDKALKEPSDKGRGAPVIETPQPDAHVPNYRRNELLER